MVSFQSVVGLGGRPDMIVLHVMNYVFLIYSDHRGMSKKTFEVNSLLLCCANLLVATCIVPYSLNILRGKIFMDFADFCHQQKFYPLNI